MFIYRKEGALSPELCNSFIETFEASDEKKPEEEMVSLA